MTLPAPIAEQVGAALGSRLARATGVGGGCVSPAWRAETEDGRRVFVKSAPSGAEPDMLPEEARSLRRLAASGAVRVPAVLATGPGWLALEWLEPGTPGPDAWSALGRSLAGLHRVRGERYGWDSDNYIGPLRQPNEPLASWSGFWAERRLRPQLALARDGHALSVGTLQRFERLLDGLGDRLAGAAADGASLLHGDLWSGNVHMTSDGAALIDPSSSFGHREVDLAMARLFGGFPHAFFTAYESVWPLESGTAHRLPVYQLYYLLVHVNLFGQAYVARTEQVLDAALR